MIDLRLTHDGRFWIAENESLAARGRTLAELDREVGRLLAANRRPEDGGSLQVRMTFDHSIIPQWIRQFSNHYFNRVVTLDLGEER